MWEVKEKPFTTKGTKLHEGRLWELSLWNPFGFRKCRLSGRGTHTTAGSDAGRHDLTRILRPTVDPGCSCGAGSMSRLD
jgi:hypothetical protein